MEYLAQIAEEFQSFLTSQQLTPPYSKSARHLMQTWRPAPFTAFDTLQAWTPACQEPALVWVEGMVQDQHEPELTCGAFSTDSGVFPTMFGRLPHDEAAEFIEGVLVERYPVTLVPLPGQPRVQMPRLVFYSEATKLNQVLRVACLYVNGDLHYLARLPKVTTTVRRGMKKEVLAVLEAATGGDALASELLLYVLMSHVVVRDHLAGVLPVNLMGVQESSVLATTLCSLTMGSYLPLDLDYLNTVQLAPAKVDDEFVHSLLQAPSHTLFVIDETTLVPGTLNEKGVKNIQTLKRLITDQIVPYFFNVCNINFHTDYQIVVLSEARSLLEIPLKLPMKVLRQPQAVLVPEQLKTYIQACQRVASSITEDVSKLAQGHFMNSQGTCSTDDLNFLLNLTRYIAKSEGQPKAKPCHWRQAVAFRNKIKERFRQSYTAS